jgi:hypothetical protein
MLEAAAADHEKGRAVTADVDEDEVYLVCSCMQQEKVKRRHIGYYECIFFFYIKPTLVARYFWTALADFRRIPGNFYY